MTGEPLTASSEDYLKIIWSAREWTHEPLTTNALAARMGNAPSTVSEAVKKLAGRGLVIHRPYGPIELTDLGTAFALQMVRRHRLVETFLVEYLDYGWEEVHTEAEVLEHAVSDLFVERLANRLGHPTRDPHGDPIPDPDGHLDRLDAVPLSQAPLAHRLTVVRVSDESEDVLRYLHAAGIELDTVLTMTERAEAVGLLTIKIGRSTSQLSAPAAEAVWVTTS